MVERNGSRGQPPLLDRELVDMFMGTLQTPYLEKMIVSMSSVFSDLIIISERIKNNMKNEKLPGDVGTLSGIKKTSSNFHKKKERETNAIIEAKRKDKVHHPLPLPFNQVRTITPNQYKQQAYPTPPIQEPWVPPQPKYQ